MGPSDPFRGESGICRKTIYLLTALTDRNVPSSSPLDVWLIDWYFGRVHKSVLVHHTNISLRLNIWRVDYFGWACGLIVDWLSIESWIRFVSCMKAIKPATSPMQLGLDFRLDIHLSFAPHQSCRDFWPEIDQELTLDRVHSFPVTRDALQILSTDAQKIAIFIDSNINYNCDLQYTFNYNCSRLSSMPDLLWTVYQVLLCLFHRKIHEK